MMSHSAHSHACGGARGGTALHCADPGLVLEGRQQSDCNAWQAAERGLHPFFPLYLGLCL